jgi:hypothetical protein
MGPPRGKNLGFWPQTIVYVAEEQSCGAASRCFEPLTGRAPNSPRLVWKPAASSIATAKPTPASGVSIGFDAGRSREDQAEPAEEFGDADNTAIGWVAFIAPTTTNSPPSSP